MPSILDAFLQRLQQGASAIPSGANPLLDVGRGAQSLAPKPSQTDVGALRQNFVNQQGAQPALPTPPPEAIAKQPQQKEGQQEQSNVLQTLIKLGIPVGAAIAGSVNPNLLPQAAGLSTGFTEEVTRQEEQKTKVDIATEKKKEAKRKEERQDRENARKAAIAMSDALSKTFPQRNVNEVLRTQKELEERILKERGLTGTEKIAEEVTEKFLPPKGAPSAKGKPDGSKLKDDSGNIVAISRDGQWVSP